MLTVAGSSSSTSCPSPPEPERGPASASNHSSTFSAPLAPVLSTRLLATKPSSETFFSDPPAPPQHPNCGIRIVNSSTVRFRSSTTRSTRSGPRTVDSGFFLARWLEARRSRFSRQREEQKATQEDSHWKNASPLALGHTRTRTRMDTTKKRLPASKEKS